MLQEKTLAEKASNSKFKTMSFKYAKNISSDRADLKSRMDTLTVLFDKFEKETANKSKADSTHVAAMNEYLFEDVNIGELTDLNDIDDIFFEKLDRIENPQNYSEDLMESISGTYMNVIKSGAVQDMLMTGEVFGQLLTHLFAVVKPTDSMEIKFSNYEAVVAGDRGFLKAGDILFENQTGFFTGENVAGEIMVDSTTTNGVLVNFGPYTVAHPVLKAYDFDEDEIVRVDYVWDNAGTDETVSLLEDAVGILREDGVVAARGSVDRNANTVSLTLDAAKPPKTGTDVVISYYYGLMDNNDVAEVKFIKTEKTVKIKTNKIDFIATTDAIFEIERRGSDLARYVDAVKQVTLRNSIDIRNLNKLYLAARNTFSIWDKNVPAGISMDEHYSSVRYAVADVISELGKNKDRQVAVEYRAFTSSAVIHFLEAVGMRAPDVYSEIKSIVKGAIGLGNIEISGTLNSNLVSVYCVPFLDQTNQHYMNATPVQSENEIVFAAVPTGEFSEIRLVAVFAIYELFRNEGNDTHDRISKDHYTSFTGFDVLEPKYFGLLIIDNF